MLDERPWRSPDCELFDGLIGLRARFPSDGETDARQALEFCG